MAERIENLGYPYPALRQCPTVTGKAKGRQPTTK